MLALILCLLFQTASFPAQATRGAQPQPQKTVIDADEPLARRFVPWMVKVRELAPQYGYRIEKDDEAWEEWFWLYYYLEGYSPRAALNATRKYDSRRGRTALTNTAEPDRSDKKCLVTEVVQEGVRSDCGAWRPLKTEKIFMSNEVRAALKVGDTFYFVWKADRWVAEIKSARTVALVFQDQSVIVSVTEAEKDLARLDKVRRRTLEQEKHHAALVQALGVRPPNELLACANLDPNRHQPLCETIRGRRLPLQRN